MAGAGTNSLTFKHLLHGADHRGSGQPRHAAWASAAEVQVDLPEVDNGRELVPRHCADRFATVQCTAQLVLVQLVLVQLALVQLLAVCVDL